MRHFTSLDADNYFALQGNAEVMQYIRPPRTREESDTFLQEKILKASPRDFKGFWVVEEIHSRVFVGCFVIIPIPNENGQSDPTKLKENSELIFFGNST